MSVTSSTGAFNATIFGHDGSIVKTGAVSFIEPWDEDPRRRIRYICLEGPEAGTYFRGQAKLSGGVASLDIPKHFSDVTAEEGMTVQLTSIGPSAGLYVAKQSLDEIIICENVGGNGNVEFNFIVHGVRIGWEEFDPIEKTPFLDVIYQMDEREHLPKHCFAALHEAGLFMSNGHPAP